MKKDHCDIVTIIFVLSSSVIIISSSHSYHHHYHHRSQGKYICTLPKNLYIVQAVGGSAWSTIFIHNTVRGFCFHRIYNIVLHAKVDYFFTITSLQPQLAVFPKTRGYIIWRDLLHRWSELYFQNFLHYIAFSMHLCFSHLMEQIQKLLDLFY